jgi:CheY-like chemotaxis protein
MVDVLIVNSSDETIEAIDLVLQQDGWTTASANIGDFQRGRIDLPTFIAEHDPKVIIWDVGLPYEENWAYYQGVRSSPSSAGREFVVTSTNVQALTKVVGSGSAAELSGERGAVEIVGKPFSLDLLRAAVRRAWDIGSKRAE